MSEDNDVIRKRMELLDAYCRKFENGLNGNTDEITVKCRIANFIGWMSAEEKRLSCTSLADVLDADRDESNNELDCKEGRNDD